MSALKIESGDDGDQAGCAGQDGLSSKNKIRDEIRTGIVRLLSRREHSRYELKLKMRQRSYDSELVDTVLEELEQQLLVSDERFAEAYSYHRRERGFGPLRIASELKERQVSGQLITEYVNSSEQYWFESAAKQRAKKFGPGRLDGFAVKAKQMRFLLQKGYTQEQISFALSFVS